MQNFTVASLKTATNEKKKSVCSQVSTMESDRSAMRRASTKLQVSTKFWDVTMVMRFVDFSVKRYDFGPNQ